MCLFQSLSYLAAETTTATNMAVFTALTPLLTVGLSTALLGEAPTIGMLGGGVLSFAGLVYLVSGGDLSDAAAATAFIPATCSCCWPRSSMRFTACC